MSDLNARELIALRDFLRQPQAGVLWLDDQPEDDQPLMESLWALARPCGFRHEARRGAE